MNNTTVKAMKSFLYDGDIKHSDSEPFDVKSCEFEELKARGLVEKAIQQEEEMLKQEMQSNRGRKKKETT